MNISTKVWEELLVLLDESGVEWEDGIRTKSNDEVIKSVMDYVNRCERSQCDAIKEVGRLHNEIERLEHELTCSKEGRDPYPPPQAPLTKKQREEAREKLLEIIDNL